MSVLPRKSCHTMFRRVINKREEQSDIQAVLACPHQLLHLVISIVDSGLRESSKGKSDGGRWHLVICRRSRQSSYGRVLIVRSAELRKRVIESGACGAPDGDPGGFQQHTK